MDYVESVNEDAQLARLHPFEKNREAVEYRDMKFEEATINEFISIYEEVHGERLTHTEATIMFRKLVHLYRVLLRPLPKKEGEETTPLS